MDKTNVYIHILHIPFPAPTLELLFPPWAPAEPDLVVLGGRGHPITLHAGLLWVCATSLPGCYWQGTEGCVCSELCWTQPAGRKWLHSLLFHPRKSGAREEHQLCPCHLWTRRVSGNTGPRPDGPQCYSWVSPFLLSDQVVFTFWREKKRDKFTLNQQRICGLQWTTSISLEHFYKAIKLQLLLA